MLIPLVFKMMLGHAWTAFKNKTAKAVSEHFFLIHFQPHLVIVLGLICEFPSFRIFDGTSSLQPQLEKLGTKLKSCCRTSSECCVIVEKAFLFSNDERSWVYTQLHSDGSFPH